MIAAASAVQGFSAAEYMAVALPLSVVLLIAACKGIGRQMSPEGTDEQVCTRATGRRAWLPLLIPLALTAAAVVWPVFGKGSISAALLLGVLLQAAQESRGVTAVVTAGMILSSDYATAIGQIPLMLRIAA